MPLTLFLSTSRGHTVSVNDTVLIETIGFTVSANGNILNIDSLLIYIYIIFQGKYADSD